MAGEYRIGVGRRARAGCRRLSVAAACAAGVLAVALCGCRSTSPVLLQMPSVKTSEVEFPLKLGVGQLEKAGSQRISSIGFTIMFFYWIDAKMPRRTETDYVLQSVADHVNDNRMFRYAYIEPFDPAKVDLTMEIKFDQYDCKNALGGVYASVLATVPYISLLPLFGVPQDIFSTRIRASCVLKTRSGQEVARYSYQGRKVTDAVTLYEMPYGNYLWYDSVFRREFDQMMTSFYGQMRNDKAKIMAAVGPGAQ